MSYVLYAIGAVLYWLGYAMYRVTWWLGGVAQSIGRTGIRFRNAADEWRKPIHYD